MQAGHFQRCNPAAEAFQQRIPVSANSQRGRVFFAEDKSEMRLLNGCLYSQTPRLFWLAMVGCIAIGSHAATKPLLFFFVLHEPMDRDGQYFKYMYLKYVFEIQNTICI